ncbi:MAG: DUF799 family lipoprotein [Paludibacteraceae bacterium]|nr:DUF799 family lipoprotein [Paludibacteraceae bacterium]
MMKRIFNILSLVSCVFLASCSMTQPVTRGEQYAKMYEEKPITFLVMPPINNSTNVDAKDLLYTSISYPLIEKGYYVLSPMLTMEVLKNESAYDAELFINGSLSMFQKYFGADAIIFSEINSWTKKGFGIETDIHFIIKSAHTNEILFERSCDLYLDLSVQSSGGGIFGAAAALIASAVNTAVTQHIQAARMANRYIVRDIPRGKYSPEYMTDQQTLAEKKDVKIAVKAFY